MEKFTISAMLGAYPPERRLPKPLPGETMAGLVIRNHPDQWKNFLERLASSHTLSKTTVDELNRGNMGIVNSDPSLHAEFERFLNHRLPVYGRTMEGLAQVRNDLKHGDSVFSHTSDFEICEVIMPRAGDPSHESQASKNSVASLGVTTVHVDVDHVGVNYNRLLGSIHGDFFWIVMGGTRIFGPEVIIKLTRIMRSFTSQPQLAMYTDQSYNMIYRMEALRQLDQRGIRISLETRDMARNLSQAGYQATADNDPKMRLSSLEAMFGGDGK